MITVRRSKERGHAKQGWLDSRHTFSFSDYQDPRFNGFRDLLVINEDRVSPGEGFGRHGHEDMEIVSYVLEGALEHKDSLGTGSVLRYGDVQRMTAGTGIKHSEFNHSKELLVHFLQIWIIPRRKGLKPAYEEKNFSEDDKRNQLRLLVSPEGHDGSLKIHQDTEIFASILEPGKSLKAELRPPRAGWIQVARGAIEVNGTLLETGDGAALENEHSLKFKAVGKAEAEFLLFDLP